MLRRIGLQNFKCWRELDIELAPITLFFGANSSGKTAILQSLLMLKQTASGFDPGQHINFGGTTRDFVDLGSYRDVVSEHDENNLIGVNVEWESKSGIHWEFSDESGQRILVRHINPDEPLHYAITWDYDDSIGVVELAYAAGHSGNTNEYIRITRRADSTTYFAQVYQRPLSKDLKCANIQGSPGSCFVIPEESLAYAGFQIDVRRLAAFYMREFTSLMDCAMHIRPIREVGPRVFLWSGSKPVLVDPAGTNTIEVLAGSARADRQLVRQVENQLRKLDLVDAFDVRPIDDNQRLYEATATIGDVDSSLTDVGSGVSQVLPVLTMLLSAPENSIILLEQPELHLHPNAQAALADLLLDVAEKRNLQLIVESHSEHIVRRLQRRVAESEHSFAAPEKIKMYYCQPGQDGSAISEVELDRFGQITDWPDRFLGDISGDLHSMARAALERRRQELERVGSRG